MWSRLEDWRISADPTGLGAVRICMAVVLAIGLSLPMHGVRAQVAIPAEVSPPHADNDGSKDIEPNQQDQFDGMDTASGLPGFIEGAQLLFKSRMYYLNRTRDNDIDSVGLALGGALELKSGWWNERVQVGGVVYTSQVLYGPEDKDGTLLFKPGPEQFTVLGEAYLTLRTSDKDILRIGRQSFDLPWLSRHDIRMAPNTFTAIALGRQSSNGLAYIAGYVDSIKRKNDDEFIPMSEAAGAAGSDKGLGLLGAQYTFADGAVIGATNQNAFDVMNTFFIKGEKSFEIADGISVRGFAQYTDQRSVGDELIGSFETYLAAVKGELSFPSGSFRLAASRAGDEKGLQSPFGGPPNYLSIIIDNFDRAGEKSVMAGMSYDLAGIGIEGISLFTNISSGRTPDVGPSASPDQTEYDLTIDYRAPKTSQANGLWLRVRGAWIDQDEAENGVDFFDFRIILNYPFDLF